MLPTSALSCSACRASSSSIFRDTWGGGQRGGSAPQKGGLRRCPPPKKSSYLGQPGLLGPLELEDAASFQQGDERQALGLVHGGELLAAAHAAVGVVELGAAGAA